MSIPSERIQQALTDRYRIERELGRGGMATVFLAEDVRHHRRVAIKVLDPEVASAIGPGRFLREIETVANLTHPHILPLYDSGNAAGFLYYVMPYVEGESLRDRLSREGALPVEEALRITREIADALGHAHAHGVVHRDIKPENVLLVAGHAVVADFGIAQAVAAGGAERLTATGVTVGTPAYMSPEQAAGGEQVDGRSDEYSLGCVLYELLAGVPPFTGSSAASLIHQHRHVAPRALTELRPSVPDWAAVAVQRALAKNSADRFSTMALFGDALSHGESADVSVAARVTSERRALPWRRWATIGVAIAVVGGAIIALRPATKTPAAPPLRSPNERNAIAVLPFQNLSANGPNAYFAGGLHDELLTQLSKIAALKVISRTSVMGYAATTKPLKQVAEELGVGALVEGSVQVVGERLRVNVQLIDAATDEHLWAEHYDRTLDDAFAIQSDVAQQIVSAVGTVLASGEREAIATAPTPNAEAYRYYLQATEYYRQPGVLRGDREAAQQLYERAIALDPNFALAHAALSILHGQMAWYAIGDVPLHFKRQRAEADIALRLAPGLPRAHQAMGLVYYWGQLDYRRGLEECQLALRASPNDAELWTFVGYLHRRLGNWAAVDSAYLRATELDPRRAAIHYNLGGVSYLTVHRYADAVGAFNRALALSPDLGAAAIAKGRVYVLWKGDLDTLRAALDAYPELMDSRAAGSEATNRAYLLLLERRADSLLVLLRDHWATSDRATWHGESVLRLFAGYAHRLRGDGPAARVAFSSALDLLGRITDAEAADGLAILHVRRGVAYAGLGRKADALKEARWVEHSVVYREDHQSGPMVAEEHAQLLALAGEPDAALDEIERLLGGPSRLTIHALRLDPRWDPIREQPRFKVLLEKYANPDGTAR